MMILDFFTDQTFVLIAGLIFNQMYNIIIFAKKYNLFSPT